MVQKAQNIFSAVLLLVLLGGAGYWYQQKTATCPVPLAYAIGSIDERFDLPETEARAAVEEAETVWEDAVGKDLFIYDPDATVRVNFVFDERQQLTLEEHRLREILDRKEDISSTIREEYERILSEYETLAHTYDTRLAAYERELAAHNAEVAKWNDQGGAPNEVYERLGAEERTLDTESGALRQLADKLDRLVSRMNALGERGNETIEDYNENVAQYNDRFHGEREFTQGDFRAGAITIYQFKDRDELRMVLTHELGHALSLDHVDDPDAIMYYLMSGQSANLALTPADLAEFKRVCEG
ncbi:matrixin family metalloprotease [Candidatus Kaiserbacteria bacterium]|nr:matrixin family metalloprotease [Candidatus Kaiserbacteria bacterium]